MPILARNGSRYAAWQTGLAIVPVSIGSIVVSNVASGVVTRRGPQLALVAGLICCTIALVLLTRIPVAGSYWRDLFPSFLVASLGMGCSFVAMTIAALSDVSEHDDQELAILALHLLQISMVYVNTLMIQRVVAEPQWKNVLKAEDLRALTPLIYGHVNPYGLFRLDMQERLVIEGMAA